MCFIIRKSCTSCQRQQLFGISRAEPKKLSSSFPESEVSLAILCTKHSRRRPRAHPKEQSQQYQWVWAFEANFLMEPCPAIQVTEEGGKWRMMSLQKSFLPPSKVPLCLRTGRTRQEESLWNINTASLCVPFPRQGQALSNPDVVTFCTSHCRCSSYSRET